jgi:prolyl-tRNA synthetase
VIIPIWRTDEDKARVLAAAHAIVAELGDWKLGDARLRIQVDARDTVRSGAKHYEHELRGVPLRIELGPRDLDKNQVMVARRDGGEKRAVPLAGLGKDLRDTLGAMQDAMLGEARTRREANSIRGGITYAKFKEVMDGPGAFVYAGWCGDAACETAIKEETKATIRCLPDEEFRSPAAPKECLKCGKTAKHEAMWAKAY